METTNQIIIDYIDNNPNSDAIDISYGLNISIEESYQLLGNLCDYGKIEKIYYGIRTYYKTK